MLPMLKLDTNYDFRELFLKPKNVNNASLHKHTKNKVIFFIICINLKCIQYLDKFDNWLSVIVVLLLGVHLYAIRFID